MSDVENSSGRWRMYILPVAKVIHNVEFQFFTGAYMYGIGRMMSRNAQSSSGKIVEVH